MARSFTTREYGIIFASILFIVALLNVWMHNSTKESYLEGSLRNAEIPLGEIARAIAGTEVFGQNEGYPTQQSPNAYVTLISGLDATLKYRGFLFNALIMHKALQNYGSTADFIAMIGLNSMEESKTYESDLNLLREHGIIVHLLDRLIDKSVDGNKLGFAEMALLKVTPWSFIQYKKVQFLDGDVLPTYNMDCYFALETNTFTVGAASPLNSGWYLAIPNMHDYEVMRSMAVDRLHRDWDPKVGWGNPLPAPSAATEDVDTTALYFRGMRKAVRLWNFNGADMDQGLLTQYFILTHGNGVLIDTDRGQSKVYHDGLLTVHGVHPVQVQSAHDTLRSCRGTLPTQSFIHFTGKSKPWLQIPSDSELEEFQRKGRSSTGKRNVFLWLQYLDSLHLNGMNSTTIGKMGLNSPLGYFNAKFPKGGFVRKSQSSS